MEKVEPDNLNVKYGGFGRTSWQIRWEGGMLYWRKFAAEWTEISEEKIQPEEQQWRDFWEALDLSRIWDWNEVYYRAADRVDANSESSDTDDPEVEADGVISWSVEILLKDGRLVDSSGSNAVPGATRRSRRSRNQRQGAKSAAPVQNSDDESQQKKSDPSNLGIPTDTFDQFLVAVKKLIGGREFADLEVDEAPETLHTQFRTLTAKLKNRPDPFAAEETTTRKKKSGKRSKISRRGSSSGRKRTTKVGEGNSSSKGSKRRRSRRKPQGGNQQQGEKVGAEKAEGNPQRRKRRRRRKRTGAPGSGEGNTSQQNTNDRNTAAKAQDAKGAPPGQKKKRRRRRRRKPGAGKQDNSGGSAATGGSATS